jgi:hypothetical protein
MSDTYVIIGIHGLANKPKEETLGKWWRASIEEGLKRNQRCTGEAVSFDLVYWRDWRYPEPVPDAENDEPYTRARGSQPLPAYEDGWFDDVRAGLGNLPKEPLDWAKRCFGVNEVADAVLRTTLKDPATYYDEPEKRDMLRQKMKDKLAKHAGKRIMVIAHSMHSIIAHDVLRAMGRDPHPSGSSTSSPSDRLWDCLMSSAESTRRTIWCARLRWCASGRTLPTDEIQSQLMSIWPTTIGPTAALCGSWTTSSSTVTSGGKANRSTTSHTATCVRPKYHASFAASSERETCDEVHYSDRWTPPLGPGGFASSRAAIRATR